MVSSPPLPGRDGGDKVRKGRPLGALDKTHDDEGAYHSSQHEDADESARPEEKPVMPRVLNQRSPPYDTGSHTELSWEHHLPSPSPSLHSTHENRAGSSGSRYAETKVCELKEAHALYLLLLATQHIIPPHDVYLVACGERVLEKVAVRVAIFAVVFAHAGNASICSRTLLAAATLSCLTKW